MLLNLRRAAVPAIVVALFACANQAGAPVRGGGVEADARAAVARLASDFEIPRLESFFDRVDKSLFSDFESFRERVRLFHVANKQVVLSLVVENVLPAGERIGVRVRWNRSYVNHAGANKLENGTCELDFRHLASGELLLAAVKGDSPF